MGKGPAKGILPALGTGSVCARAVLRSTQDSPDSQAKDRSPFSADVTQRERKGNMLFGGYLRKPDQRGEKAAEKIDQPPGTDAGEDGEFGV